MPNATLCFVKKGNKILMINREKSPFMGMWNAVGGHIEKGESVLDCAKREIFEESGITVDNAELISTFTWNYDSEVGYATLSTLKDDFDTASFPLSTREGLIDFKDIEWIVNPKNYGVIEDLRIFIADIAKGEKNDYHFVYEGSRLVKAIKGGLKNINEK